MLQREANLRAKPERPPFKLRVKNISLLHKTHFAVNLEKRAVQNRESTATLIVQMNNKKLMKLVQTLKKIMLPNNVTSDRDVFF